MPTTSNFGWTTPADTDLVKDGAAAIRTLGNNIDASLVDLKGGTTGQVLAKASNTDLDFTWSSVDPLTILDAKGDLITATAADTPARLAVGTNGQYLQADSTTATGLKWASGGGLTELSTTSLSGTSTTISGISASYQQLLIRMYDFFPSAAAGIRFSFNANSGTLHSYHYEYSSTSDQNSSGGGANVDLFGAQQNIEAVNNNNVVTILVDNYANTTTFKPFNYFGGVEDQGGSFRPIQGSGWYRSTSAISSLIISTSGVQTLSGTVKIFGVN